VLCLLIAVFATTTDVTARSRAPFDPLRFYHRIVAAEISENPNIASNKSFTADYASLFGCSKATPAKPSAKTTSPAALVETLKKAPSFVTYSRNLHLEREGNRLTVGPTLAYDESSVLLGTDLSGLDEKTPWHTCGPIDWKSGAFPQDVTLVVDNPQSLRAVNVPMNKARFAKNTQLRIRAKIVSVDASDPQDVVAHAMLDAFTVLGGNRHTVVLQHWTASGAFAVAKSSPLTCFIKGAPWLTPVALDGNSYVHARIVMTANERLLLDPEEFDAIIHTNKATFTSFGYSKLLPFYDNLGHDLMSGRDAIDAALQSLTPNDPGQSKNSIPQIKLGQDFGFIQLIELEKGQTARWIVSFQVHGVHRSAHLLTLRWGNFTTCLPKH